MKTIETLISWTSNEYSDTPKMVRIELTDAELTKIELCKKLIKLHDLDCIKISVNAELLNENPEDLEFNPFPNPFVESDWRADTQMLNITSYGVYFYAQSKWDSGDQIESECITELFN